MASITKLKDGGFYVQVRIKGHAHQFKKFRTEEDAKRWAEITEIAIRSNDNHQGLELPNQTLLEVGLLYCSTVLKGKKSQQDMADRVHRVSKHFPQAFKAITNHDVNNYRLLRLKKVSGATVRDELRMIKRLFLWLNREYLLGLLNPCDGIVIPPPSKPRDKVVTEEEMKLILAELSPVMAQVIELLYLTGMRRSEVLKLRKQDLHLDMRILDVVDGKTGSRSVPLSKKAVELLQRVADSVKNDKARLFPIAAYSVTQALRRAREKLGLSDDIRVHQLRHTRISLVAKKGFNNAQIMAVSGHKDVRSVQRYTHLSAVDVVDLLD